MSKILIIDTCLDCKNFCERDDEEYDKYDRKFEGTCMVAGDDVCVEKKYGDCFPKWCPLKDTYQEQEQEYMDRIKK